MSVLLDGQWRKSPQRHRHDDGIVSSGQSEVGRWVDVRVPVPADGQERRRVVGPQAPPL